MATLVNKIPYLWKEVQEITNGPAKYDFQASNFDGKVVEFTVHRSKVKGPIQIGRKLKVNVLSAGREDGSNDSWFGEIFIHETESEASETRAYYYNTRTRRGTVSERGKRWRLITATPLVVS